MNTIKINTLKHTSLTSVAIITYQWKCDASFTLDITKYNAGLILGLQPANENRRYKVTPYLIGWVQT